MSRTKGAVGEREAAALLTKLLGFKVERKIGASRDGGSDIEIDGKPGWSIEVKRREKLNIQKWWEQTEENADKEERRPLLMWRKNRMQWATMWYHEEKPVITSLSVWVDINFPLATEH
jgi:Holliday junction resolvase